jgi:hypothetical protein
MAEGHAAKRGRSLKAKLFPAKPAAQAAFLCHQEKQIIFFDALPEGAKV